MVRHVIFDLDGTLVDSCAACIAILTEMLEERGSANRIDPVAARAHMSRGGEAMVAALLGADCVDAAADLIEFRERYTRFTTPTATVFPRVADSLAMLRAAGLALAICSNKPQNLCERVLADTGLAQHFTAIVGGRPELRAKPEPDLLKTVLDVLGARADDCIFVGDSELDHRTADALGIAFLFLTYGYAEAGWLPPGCASFDCFGAMSSTILQHAGMSGAGASARVGHA